MNASLIGMREMLTLFGVPLLAALIMSVICGFVGCFIVLRRLSFLTDTIAHSSTLGIALGLLWSVSPQITLIPFSITLTLLLAWLSESQKENLVSLTAVAFSLCMGLGALILTRFGVGDHEIVEILFGDLLWITVNDLIILIALTVPVLSFLFLSLKPLTLIFVSPDLASARGIRVRLYEKLFLVCIGVVIAVCIKLVGVYSSRHS